MNAGKAKHDYHLVEPSPWPFLGALSVFIMLLGAAMALNVQFDFIGLPPFVRPWICGCGAVLTLLTLAGWWRDVIAESVRDGEHRPVVKLSFRFAMVLFLAVEAAFFVALMAAVFGSMLFGGVHWPPAGVIPPDPFKLPLLATLVMLLAVSATVWARRAVRQDDRPMVVTAAAVAAGLSLVFTALLAWNLAHAPFGFGFSGAKLVLLADPAQVNPVSLIGAPGAAFSSAFFLAAGFLALRGLVGTAFLTVCALRAALGHFTPSRHLGFEAAAWYWQFGAVLWLFLYFAVYLCGYLFALRA